MASRFKPLRRQKPGWALAWSCGKLERARRGQTTRIDADRRVCYVFGYAERSEKVKRRAIRTTQSSAGSHKLLKNKALKSSAKAKAAPPDPLAPAKQAQMKCYEEALKYFQQQKFHKAKESLERVLDGPSKELGDRAQMHLRICEQRISRAPVPVAKSAEDHYTQGVALMNLGRWDEAREHLDRARKAAPKADHIVYAMAALDCLTGEAESAMQNLKVAIQLRPENRYHARNDEDFAFLQEDPRFTELLYPERDGSAG
jgi:tetratricopeptide (TPR) repeat protein